jgi:hypothetical protein
MLKRQMFGRSGSADLAMLSMGLRMILAMEFKTLVSQPFSRCHAR